MATKRRAKRPAPRRAARRPQRRQPESLRLRSMSVSLTANDFERSVAWYRDVLGFTVGERWEQEGRVRGVQVKAGRCDIMLKQDDFAKGRDRKKGEGIRIWVETAQDLDALAARIKAKGGVLDSEPRLMPWGDKAFALTDPSGFKITFVQAS